MIEIIVSNLCSLYGGSNEFYFHFIVKNWKEHINSLINELSLDSFPNRDLNSTKMRISNIEYLHTGVGLSKASKQTRDVYNSLK